ncbi:MAG: cardiolipin synthase B, partial [Chloroflexota bacterium]
MSSSPTPDERPIDQDPARGPEVMDASMRALADLTFSRTAGAPLVPGNTVRILKDGKENYPAWLEA